MFFLILQSLAMPAFQVGFDIVIRMLWVSKGGSRWDADYYFAGLFSCLLLSLAFVSLTALIRKISVRGSWCAAGVLGLVHTVLLVTNALLFQFFGEYLFPGAVAFVMEDKQYILDYLHTFGGPWMLVLFLALWTVCTLFFVPWNPKRLPRWWWLTAVLIISLVVGVKVLNRIEKMSEFRMTPDVVAVESLSKHFLRVHDKVWPLRPSERIGLQETNARVRPRTVLFILNESMGIRSIEYLRDAREKLARGDTIHARPGLPRMTAWLTADSANAVIFERAFTASMATQVSMPAIFSGVSPEESHQKLHRVPLLWDMAKQAGYRTAYFSSQRLRWASMSDFLLKEPIDSLVAKEQTEWPVANDMGMDDFHSVATIETFVRNHPDEPLFILWNTNALHAPFQEQSEFVDLSQVPGDRFEKALWLLDSAVARVFQVLQETGRMDDALIINTGDHGEDPNPSHPFARHKSYYDEFIRVPVWIRLPVSLQATAVAQGLRGNRNQPVSNIDLAPTLADLWGLRMVTDSLPLKGASLLRPVDSSRVLTVLSTNDTRLWEGEGFGLVHGNWRYLLWPDSGRCLYNAAEDPGETRNLVASAPDSVLRPFYAHIDSNAWLKRIHDHHLSKER